MSPGGKGGRYVGLNAFLRLCADFLEILGASTACSPNGSKRLNNLILCWKMDVKILRNSIFHIYIRIRVLFPSPLRTNSVLGEKSFNSFVEFVYISFYVFVRLLFIWDRETKRKGWTFRNIYFNARCNTPPNFRDYIQLKQKSDFTLPYFTLLYYKINSFEFSRVNN